MESQPRSQTTRRTRLLLLLLLLLLTGPGMTQGGQVVGNGYNNSLIYKIQSGTNTVYILGSIHVLAEEYYPLTRSFSYAYYNSQKVIFEIDPEILFAPDSFIKYEKQYTFPNGRTGNGALAKNLYAGQTETRVFGSRYPGGEEIQTLGPLSHPQRTIRLIRRLSPS